MSKKQTSVISNVDFDSKVNSQNVIVKPILIEENEQINRCAYNLPESNIKICNKRIKQKIVNKVKSWSNKQKNIKGSTEIDFNLSKSFKRLNISSTSAEELHRPLLQKENDSLENSFKDEQESDKREENWTEYRKLSSVFCDQRPSTSSAPGPLWNLYNEEEHKSRNGHKNNKKILPDPSNKEDNSIPPEGSHECKENSETIDNGDVIEGEYPYKYKLFKKNSKSVVFTNEVFVVYFNGDEVIYESKEPLKKGNEQQMRNKEMRHGHLLKTQEKYNLCLF